jgi:hypothetical protein
MASTAQPQQQQQEQQQEQQQQQQDLHPQLLEGLPADALRQVLQLATTSSSPALCRLACTSKSLRAAAEAAAVPIDLRVNLRIPEVAGKPLAARLEYLGAFLAYAARQGCLRAWLRDHAPILRGLAVLHDSCHDVAVEEILLTVLSSTGAEDAAAAAAAAAARDSKTATASKGAGAGAGRSRRRAGKVPGKNSLATPKSRLKLESLHLRGVRLTPGFTDALVRFDQLQVLTVTSSSRLEPATQNLPKALSQLKQLQRLGLHLDNRHKLPAEALLQSLPLELKALDLEASATTSSSTSSSSVARLGHLTSLRLKGVQLVSDLPPSGQQQQQGTSTLAARVGPSLTFAALPMQAVDLCLANSDGQLALLACCPHLRQLRAYFEDVGPSALGVSALTQLTHLWLTVLNHGPSGASARVCQELASLQQLRILEVNQTLLQATHPETWLPQLGSLEQLVVLWFRWSQDVRPLNLLTEAISGWHSSSSSTRGNSNSASTTSSSDSSSSGPAGHQASTTGIEHSNGSDSSGVQAAHFKLACLQVTLLPKTPGVLLLAEQQAAHRPVVQGAVADMAAALPWLQVVTCAQDARTSPCWNVEDEVQVG